MTFLMLKAPVCFTSGVFFFVPETKNNTKIISSPPSPSVKKIKGFYFSAWHMGALESSAVMVCELSLFGHILFSLDIYVLLYCGRN